MDHQRLDDSGPDDASAPDVSPSRTRTLRLPAPSLADQGLGSDAPFLIELERETTRRFIANTARTADCPQTDEYTVEVVALP